ncbi:MAG: cytochrome c [Actinobacteria bacterium]|nr:cytochrome c [Actinomycetota bacterium]
MKTTKSMVIGFALLAIGIVGLIYIEYFYTGTDYANLGFNEWSTYNNMMGGINFYPKKYTSNGEQIYFTATSKSGSSIIANMGMMAMNFPMMSCASCHGKDGKGGTIRMMMGTFKVPNITHKELTEEEKPPYTNELLKRAITKGIDHKGERLGFPMPVWSMSEKDLNDLVDYLKTL